MARNAIIMQGLSTVNQSKFANAHLHTSKTPMDNTSNFVGSGSFSGVIQARFSPVHFSHGVAYTWNRFGAFTNWSSQSGSGVKYRYARWSIPIMQV